MGDVGARAHGASHDVTRAVTFSLELASVMRVSSKSEV